MQSKKVICCACNKGKNDASFTNSFKLKSESDDVEIKKQVEELKSFFQIDELVKVYDTTKREWVFRLCNECFKKFYKISFSPGVHEELLYRGYTKKELDEYCKNNNIIPGYASMKHQKLAHEIWKILNGFKEENEVKKGKRKGRKSVTPNKKIKKDDEEIEVKLEDKSADDESVKSEEILEWEELSDDVMRKQGEENEENRGEEQFSIKREYPEEPSLPKTENTKISQIYQK